MAHSGPVLATASGYQNNCGFHCIAHTMLALTDAQLIELSRSRPIYQTIAQKFYQRYDIQGAPTFEGMLRIVRSYAHPFDHEILLGPVLRQTLRESIQNPTSDQVNQLQDFHQVEDETLSKLTEALGFDLYVCEEGRDSGATLYFPVASGSASTFAIGLTHTGSHVGTVNGVQTQFGHFNFSFPDPSRNATHNENIQLQYGPDRQILQNNAELFNVAFEQDNANLQRAVKSRAVQILGSQMDPLFDVTTSLDSQMDPLFDVTVPTLKATHEPSPSKPMYHPKADDKKIENAFLQYLKQLFPETNWNYRIDETGYNLESKSVAGRHLSIDKHADGMQFTASGANFAEDIAQAANAYSLALEENKEDVEFEMNVADEAQCVELLNRMSTNQLDLSKISTIRVDGQELTEERRNELIEQSSRRCNLKP